MSVPDQERMNKLESQMLVFYEHENWTKECLGELLDIQPWKMLELKDEVRKANLGNQTSQEMQMQKIGGYTSKAWG